MTIKRRLFIHCDEANINCDKSQYNEASYWDKLKLTLHLLFCKACRNYSKNNAKLSKLVKEPNVDCLSQKERNNLKDQFNKVLHHQDIEKE